MINAPGLPPLLLHTVSNLKLDNGGGLETRLTENVLLGIDRPSLTRIYFASGATVIARGLSRLVVVQR